MTAVLYVAQIDVGGTWVDAPDPSAESGKAQYTSGEEAAAAPRDPSLTYRLVLRRPGVSDEPLS